MNENRTALTIWSGGATWDELVREMETGNPTVGATFAIPVKPSDTQPLSR